MDSISIFAWVAVVLGFILSGMIGIRNRGQRGCLIAFALALAATGLSVALSFGTGFLHYLCEYKKLCVPTTDITVWSIAYPMICAPLYWIVILVVKGAGQNSGETET